MGLCLRRQEGERIVIGRGDLAITITVFKVGRGGVSLHFDAPHDLPIMREELVGVRRDTSGRLEDVNREDLTLPAVDLQPLPSDMGGWG